MIVLACAAFVVAAVSCVWNLYQSYQTEGGTQGMVPVLAAPVLHQAPLVTLGSFLFFRSTGDPLPWWHLAGIFVGVAAVGVAATIWIGGYKTRRRRGKC